MREDSSNLLESKNKQWIQRQFRNIPPTYIFYFLKPLKTIFISAENFASYQTTHWWPKCFHHIAIRTVIFSPCRGENTLHKEWSQSCFQVSRERCKYNFSFGDKLSWAVRSMNTNVVLASYQILIYSKVATQGTGHGAQDKEHMWTFKGTAGVYS